MYYPLQIKEFKSNNEITGVDAEEIELNLACVAGLSQLKISSTARITGIH